MTGFTLRRRFRNLEVACSALAIGIASPGVAFAQDTAPEASDVAQAEPEASGEIVVTGSRLRGVAPVGSSVTVLGREEVELSGAVTTDRLIQQLPQVFDLGVSENSRGQGGGSGNITYGNTINLRGIGPYATLILVDGHRAVNNSRAFEPSVIPTLGLERVEVVADGASAIYGSDAIAGVVNLIPRRSLNGVEATARYGAGADFDESQLGVAFGKTWSTGQAMLAYERVYRSNLSGDDRDFFRSDQRAFGGNNYSVTRCSPGTLRAGGVSYALPTQLTAANAGSLVAGSTNSCNDLIGQDLIPAKV